MVKKQEYDKIIEMSIFFSLSLFILPLSVPESGSANSTNHRLV